MPQKGVSFFYAGKRWGKFKNFIEEFGENCLMTRTRVMNITKNLFEDCFLIRFNNEWFFIHVFAPYCKIIP